MPKRLKMELNAAQQEELERIRDRALLAYLRERAAILKLAQGMSGPHVARTGLLKRRKPDTVYGWVHRYQAQGLAGLQVKSGRGRKPVFFPSGLTEADPRQLGQAQSRWTLAAVRASCGWLAQHSLAGIWQLLARLRIVYKRSRDYVHSPDPHYLEKLAAIQAGLAQVRADPQRFVLLYLDEVSYYRQPSGSQTYEQAGHVQPLAHWSYRSSTHFRIIAALNALMGQVTFDQHSKIGLAQLPQFFATLRAAYPHAETIFIVLDNWPMHFHPDVLSCLPPQPVPWPARRPGNWPTQPTHPPTLGPFSIQLLCLPSYASWLNPIEKLWRSLRQNVLHLHRLADDWPALRQLVAQYLSGFQSDSPELLRYVGLFPD